MVPDEPLIAELTCAIPGRLRLRLPAATPSALEDLAGALEGIRSVHGVRRGAASRSVVVAHVPGSETLEEVRRALWGRSVKLRDPVVVGHRQGSTGLDQTVRRLTGDGGLPIVIPAWLAGLAVVQAVRGDDRLRDAPWYVLAWYAYSTAVMLRRGRAG